MSRHPSDPTYRQGSWLEPKVPNRVTHMLPHSTHLLNSKLGGGGSSLNASRRQLVTESVQARSKLPARRSEGSFQTEDASTSSAPSLLVPSLPWRKFSLKYLVIIMAMGFLGERI